jgi:hypothetical protein
VKHYETEIDDWFFNEDKALWPVELIDYYRGLYTILCEETVYSLTMIIFIIPFWYRTLKDIGAWILRNTIMRLVKRH